MTALSMMKIASLSEPQSILSAFMSMLLIGLYDCGSTDVMSNRCFVASQFNHKHPVSLFVIPGRAVAFRLLLFQCQTDPSNEHVNR